MNIELYGGARTLYLYTRGTVGDPPEALRQLLRYMEQSTDENAVNDSLKRIHHMVETVKRDGEVALSYMKSRDREEQIRKEERQKVEQEKQLILSENQRLREEIVRYKKELAELSVRS